MKKLILLVALALVGCGEQVDDGRVGRSQEQLSNAKIACRDGVQYLVYPLYGNGGIAITARIKPDGKPYLCSRQPTAYKEQPIG